MYYTTICVCALLDIKLLICEGIRDSAEMEIYMDLEKAIRENRLDIVQQILIENPSKIEERPSGIWLPFLAARLGREEIVRYFVEYSRASFNERDADNRTILHYAVESGKLSLVQYLTERVGNSPVDGDIHRKTPFQLACERNLKHIEAYFEEFCGCSLDQMYQNPILTGMYPDPSIICVGEDFYMVNSSFIYFPCIPISHSRDLIHWQTIGHAVTNPEWAELDNLEGGRGYWAPDISFYQGKYYITATYRLNDTGNVYRRQMVVSSEKPEGPYSKPVFIDEDGIDPSIFTDDDGKRYMLLNRGARIFEISPDGKEKCSEAKLLYYGTQKRAPEGAHLLKKDGWYYLFQAEGGTGPGHRITVSRSRELFGIYKPCPYNPIMRQKDEHAAIQRCGHGKPVQTPNGEWFMVYLCGRQIDRKYSILGRETALDPITWTADGWPIVNQLQGPSVLQKKPRLPEYIFEEPQKAFWESGILSPEWVTPRPPEPDAIHFYDGCLRLKGSSQPLSTKAARNILLCRQKHFCFTFQADIRLPEMKEGQECGITCYYDENTYLTFGFIKEKEQIQLQIKEHIGDQNRSYPITTDIKFQENTLYKLQVETNYLKRSFFLAKCSMSSNEGIEKKQENKNQSNELCLVLSDVNYLCDEGLSVGKRFTGAMVGLYAYSGKAELYVDFKNIFYNEGKEE